MSAPHDSDFRASAIQMVNQHGRRVFEAAKNLGISESCLRGWLKQSEAAGSPAELDTHAEPKMLRTENAQCALTARF